PSRPTFLSAATSALASADSSELGFIRTSPNTVHSGQEAAVSPSLPTLRRRYSALWRRSAPAFVRRLVARGSRPGADLSTRGRLKVSDLVPRLGDALDALLGDQGRVPRDVVRAVQREHARGLIQTARVDARAQVTRTALVNTALLSADEASFIQMAP